MASYNTIRDSLKTGDIVLFSGKGLISLVIKKFTDSLWTHVGMVIKSDELDTLLLWESTTLSKMKDIESNTARQGVQSVFLSKRIEDYDGDVAIRKLNIDRTPKMIDGLKGFRKESKEKPYERNFIEAFKGGYEGIGGENTEDLSSLFCSELVAEAYQRMGLLKDNEKGGKPSNEYTPADFSSDKNSLELIEGTLEKEVYVGKG